MNYRHILPEIAMRRRPATYMTPTGYEEVPAQSGPPTFPEACPACGAGQTDELDGYRGCAYACGARYTEKPQIQNHTDIWWGSCPVVKASEASA